MIQVTLIKHTLPFIKCPKHSVDRPLSLSWSYSVPNYTSLAGGHDIHCDTQLNKNNPISTILFASKPARDPALRLSGLGLNLAVKVVDLLHSLSFGLLGICLSIALRFRVLALRVSNLARYVSDGRNGSWNVDPKYCCEASRDAEAIW
jgi:hypothetical protein